MVTCFSSEDTYVRLKLFHSLLFVVTLLGTVGTTASAEAIKPCYKDYCVGSFLRGSDKFWENDPKTKEYSFNSGNRSQCYSVLRTGFALPDNHQGYDKSGTLLLLFFDYVAETGEILTVASTRVLPKASRDLSVEELFGALFEKYGKPVDIREEKTDPLAPQDGRFTMKYDLPDGMNGGITIGIRSGELHSIGYMAANSSRLQEIMKQQRTCGIFQD